MRCSLDPRETESNANGPNGAAYIKQIAETLIKELLATISESFSCDETVPRGERCLDAPRRELTDSVLQEGVYDA